jgi:hypothetical protein
VIYLRNFSRIISDALLALLTPHERRAGKRLNVNISHLKKIFSPDISVEPLPQVLDILEYACGLSLGFALVSNENPNFEIASHVS